MRLKNAVAWCCVLLAVHAEAQVPNDDCAGGFAQGIWQPPSWSTDCDDPGDSNNGIVIQDSTQLAVPNFPYPTNPSACIGYTTMVAAPANDRWYAVQVGCELGFTVECSDTCHISFWSGDNCGMLTPLDCYTIPPNTPTTGMVWTLDNVPGLPDTVLIQISGNGVGQHTHYTLCLTNPTPPCDPIYVEPAPTPVTCMLYDAEVTDATGPLEADGAIDVQVTLGNGPFIIDWADGGTAFSRSGLSPGAYPYLVTDIDGCAQQDTAHVSFSIPQSVSLVGERFQALSVVPNPATSEATLVLTEALAAPGVFVVYDATGAEVMRHTFPKDMPRLAFSTAVLAPALYHYRVFSSTGVIGTGKLTIVR